MHFTEWIPCYFDSNSIEIFPNGPINNKPALVEITALRRAWDKPLSESMMVLYNFVI